MTPEAIEYFSIYWRTWSINRLRRRLGELYKLHAWDAIRLIKPIIAEKRQERAENK
jgi:hypothetical protein